MSSEIILVFERMLTKLKMKVCLFTSILKTTYFPWLKTTQTFQSRQENSSYENLDWV